MAPVSSSEFALEWPMRRGRRYVEVALMKKIQHFEQDIKVETIVPSGTIPRRTNGKVSLAPAQTKRKSKGK